MTTLSRSTWRRLQNLHQVSSVWEGARRSLSAVDNSELGSASEQGECILWVDGVQGVIRAMDVVAAEAGPEAIVRTLLQAMESPPSPAKPARPQKIVVCDREIQFFLRGVFQQLGIAIDYAPELPLIDEIFRGLQEVIDIQPPTLPPQYVEPLENKAYQLWQAAPWEYLEEHQVLALKINHWGLDTLYASVLIEPGILLYRSLDSLKQFRQRMLTDESPEQLEDSFLGQDCFFLTFERVDEPGDAVDFSLLDSQCQPHFGSLHPLEGLRSFLDDEEATIIFVALEALRRFFDKYRSQLRAGNFPALSSRYRIPLPQGQAKQSISIQVQTMPELAAELLAIAALGDTELAEDALDFLVDEPILRDDLVPQHSHLSLGMMPWEIVTCLRETKHYQSGSVPTGGDGLPIVLIQTTQPKAKTLIQELEQAGGLGGICFNPGEDPWDGERYELGILQTANGELHLFGEFSEDDPVHREARRKWDQRCQKTQGWCALVVAKGVTGASRGNPRLQDMLALFEVRSLQADDLGLGMLQLMPQLE